MVKNLKACTPPCKYEEMIDSVYDYVAARQNVYMEIGLQCGARLIVQLLGK